MRKNTFILLAAALLIGMSLVSCQREMLLDEPCEPSAGFVLTLEATKAADAETKTLAVSGSTLTATWSNTDQVKVYNSSSVLIGTLSVKPDALDDTRAVMSGTLNPAPSVNDVLTLKYLSASYGTQDGTLTGNDTSIDKVCDYAVASVTVSSVNTASKTIAIVGNTASFVNQQAIVKFTFVVGGGTPVSLSGLTISGGASITVTPSSPTNELYVALPAVSGATLNFAGTGGVYSYSYSKSGVTFAAGSYYTRTVTLVKGPVDLSVVTSNFTAQDGDVLTGTLGRDVKISIADGATVTLSDATINGVDSYSYMWAGLNCLGDATIILADGTTNTVKGFCNNYPGIHVPSGSTLTIEGTGTLDARSNGWAAGIGGGSSISCGNITINGGTITAIGGNNGAGIGCGKATCGNISITGGTVEATGGSNAAGIGGSTDTSCGNISITGGTVTAMGGSSGAGIGSGCRQSGSSSCGTITISGCTVTATGGSYAAGIGSGSNASCGDITIENTVTSVTATKGSSAPNSIGKGYNGTCGTVTIGGNEGAISTSPYTYDPAINLSTVNSNYTVQDHEVLTGTLGSNVQISIADGARITLRNATISPSSYSGLKCLGSATITLVGSNATNGGSMKAGIEIGGAGTTLTINGPGSLNASGGLQSAGIGISRAWDAGAVSGGNIVINGGTITAQGNSQWGAGIGTGVAYGSAAVTIGDITINGGEVTAIGGSDGGGGAAGIGTSYSYSGGTTNMGNITISGGVVIATGYGSAAGIGTGFASSSNASRVSNITINSTVTRVTATKGSSATHSIGKGASNSEIGTVTIGGNTGAISDSPYTYQP